jgi:hypothetical protein
LLFAGPVNSTPGACSFRVKRFGPLASGLIKVSRFAYFFYSIACLTSSSTGFISIHSGFHMIMYLVPSRRRIMGWTSFLGMSIRSESFLAGQLRFYSAWPIITRPGGRLALIFSRHARRQMKWRRVSEAEVVSVLDAPDQVESSQEKRINLFKLLSGRLLKVTYIEENGNMVVITVIEKASV